MKRRIIISLGLLLGVCLLGDVTAMYCLDRSIGRLSDLAESHRIQSMRANLTTDSVRVELDLLSDLAGHKHAADQRLENAERFTRSLNACGRCHHPPDLLARFAAIRESLDAYREVSEELFSMDASQRSPQVEQKAISLADRFVEQTTDAAEMARVHLIDKGADASASVHRARLILACTFVAALIFGGVVALHLKRRLTRPVEALLEGIGRAQRGDLSYRFPLADDPEFRMLAQALNEAYEELQKVQDSVIQAEKLAAIGKLSAGVAHEVLNPLASISSIAQMMERHSGSDEQKNEIALIMEQVARITHILRDLLTFSRPTPVNHDSSVDVGNLVERARTLVDYDKRARQVVITCQIDPDLHTIRADSERLLLVFTNLIINALDAIATDKETSGHLAISVKQVDEMLTISFEDDGPGISPENLPQAFEPFFTTKAPGSGTGLGLWICYQVVQKHGGTIRIDSEVGRGTAVIIQIPTVVPAEGEEEILLASPGS